MLLAAACLTAAWPQTALDFSGAGGAVRILNDDLAVLESPEDRQDLRCRVQVLRPEFGFDLRFHAGYQVLVPLSELVGSGDQLRLLMRITPEKKHENRLYLVDRYSVPPIEEGANGEASLPGRFSLGPGRYQVDWLMRNRGERVCSAHWEMEAKPDEEDSDLTLPAHTVAQHNGDPFVEQPPVERASPELGLHVKLLVNFSPPDPQATILKPWEIEAIVSILRGVTREPRFRSFTLVAFNMQQERIIYRADNVPRIDFPALGEAVQSLRLGTVDYQQLLDPDSDTRFLTGLLTEHLGSRDQAADAIVIVGPKVMLEKGIPQEALQQAGGAGSPVFYLNYNSDPRRNPWRDAIGAALKAYRGLQYTIRAPRDLGSALTDMMFRLARR